MVPTQKRPAPSTWPSLKRVMAVSYGAAAISVRRTSSLPVSRCAKPLRMATTRPPWSLTARVAGSLDSFHERCAPVAGSRRCTVKAGMSTQYSACSCACHRGHSPVCMTASNATFTSTSMCGVLMVLKVLCGFGHDDQAIGGTVVAFRLDVASQLRVDVLGEDLAQLHAPLVEAVDVPDHALHKGLVLVQRDQRAQGGRRQLVHQNGVGRTVAGEGLVRHQLVDFGIAQFLRGQVGAHFGGLAG